MVQLLSSGPLRIALCGLLVLAPATDSRAQAPNPDRLPTLAFSIAHRTPGRTPNGPLFERVRAALAAANEGEGAGFARFLARDSQLELTWFDGSQSQRRPFGVPAIRAATNSCMGPYSFDEGSSWAQLSWVCRVDGEAPLAALLTFRHSPELTLTVWFENGLIKRMAAMEPIPIPGRSLVAMDAFRALQGNR